MNKQTTKSKTGTTPRASVASSVVTRNTVSVRLLHPSLLICLFILISTLYSFPVFVHWRPEVSTSHLCTLKIGPGPASRFLMRAEKTHTLSNECGNNLVVSDSAHTSSFRHVSSWMETSACASMCLCVSLAEQVLTQFLCCGLASPEHDLEYTEGHSHSYKRSRIKMQGCNGSSASKDRKTEAEDIQHLSQWIYRKLNLVSLSLFPTISKSGLVSKPLIHCDRWENVPVFPHSVCDVWPEFISKTKPHLVIVWLERRFSLCAFVMESGWFGCFW